MVDIANRRLKSADCEQIIPLGKQTLIVTDLEEVGCDGDF